MTNTTSFCLDISAFFFALVMIYLQIQLSPNNFPVNHMESVSYHSTIFWKYSSSLMIIFAGAKEFSLEILWDSHHSYHLPAPLPFAFTISARSL